MHELEQLDSSYKVEETENLTGMTGTQVTPGVKNYTGFTAPATQTVTIEADGSTKVTYKYTRNSYEITYTYTSDKSTPGAAKVSKMYGAEVTLAGSLGTPTGYTFKGWTTEDKDIAVIVSKFTMPAKNVTFTAEYTANKYEISYDLDGGTFGDKHPTKHIYGTETVISDLTKVGYTFTGWKINGGTTLDVGLTLGAKDYTDDITLTAMRSLDIDPKYDVKLPTTGKGDVSARPDPAGEADTVIITVEPDDGYVVKDIEVIDKDGNRLPVRDLGDNRFSFIMPKSDVTVNVTYTERRGFDDVFVRDYYYDAVNWAVDNGITTGVGNSLFAPNDKCTRGQIVTFLWCAYTQR